MKIDKFIAFYKRYISPLNPPACRFYPTCSEYAALCFRFDNPPLALFKSLTRILKCNQLFSGGISYPRIALDTRPFSHHIPLQSPPNKNAFFKQNIAFWLVPCVDLDSAHLDSPRADLDSAHLDSPCAHLDSANHSKILPKFAPLKRKNNAKITHKFFAIKSLKG